MLFSTRRPTAPAIFRISIEKKIKNSLQVPTAQHANNNNKASQAEGKSIGFLPLSIES